MSTAEHPYLQTVIDLLLAGVRQSQIGPYLADNFEDPPSADELAELVEIAAAEIRRRFAEDPELESAIAHSRLHDLYTRALRASDYSTCLSIVRAQITLRAKMAETAGSSSSGGSEDPPAQEATAPPAGPISFQEEFRKVQEERGAGA